ncbi:integrase [Gossypium australe]|uniref:Integrase n=1 Tax=Gossypium australe TaxID=47621 RepID=A0A5B6VL44_9ROSI|nr:integrase [Gossypium australe]
MRLSFEFPRITRLLLEVYQGIFVDCVPLTELLQKNTLFLSFEKLKYVLTQTSVLVQPQSGREFVLKLHEGTYPMHGLELASIVFALNIWRHYLYCERCIIYTNHKSLKYMLTQKELNLRQQYHLGKANIVIDSLSCRVMTDLRVIFAHLSLFEDRSLLAKM